MPINVKATQHLESKTIKENVLKSSVITDGLEPVADSESEFLILGTLQHLSDPNTMGSGGLHL